MSNQQENSTQTFEHIVALTGITMLIAVVIFMWYMIVYLPGLPQLPEPTGVPLTDSTTASDSTAIIQ